MENAQKAIMIGVGLFITIIIIAAVMLITGMGQNLLNQGQSQVNGISESLMNDLFQQYNGKVMSGAQVRTAAVQLVNRDDAASFTVKIQSGTSQNGNTYVEISGDTVKINGTTSTNSKNTAINNVTANTATKQYKGSVTNTSGTITVTFDFK